MLNYRRLRASGSPSTSDDDGWAVDSSRRGFLKRAGLGGVFAAAVVGGLDVLGAAPARAAGAGTSTAGVSSPGACPVCELVWTCSPGDCGSACPSPKWCYRWVNSCTGHSGFQCNFNNCATHVQCVN